MKYNWSIIGHEKQLNQIEQDIESDNLAHAYLLSGPNSVGKYTVAKKMAGILQCDADFCHQCNTCLQVQKGSHIDTIEMKGNTESIKISDVRLLIERLHLSGQSKYKVLIMQSIERMTKEAANSFLKMLEEPPKRTIFLLSTNKIGEILPTIISRVRTIKFGAVSYDYLHQKLDELYPESDEKKIKDVCLFSLGKTGKAVHLMENPDSLANYMKVYSDVQSFLDHRNVADRFSYVEDLVSDAKQVEVFFSILTNVLRSKLLDDVSKESHPNREKQINTLLKIGEAGMLLKKNVNQRLILENLMLSL